MGLSPYGTEYASTTGSADTAPTSEAPLVALRVALRQGNFWRLWLTFAICGATTNGLIGTHLIPHAIDQGLSAMADSGACPAATCPAVQYEYPDRMDSTGRGEAEHCTLA